MDVGLDPQLSVQQLDDNPVADEEDSVVLRDYYVRYREIAAKCGISLADESKPEKTFPPSAKGERDLGHCIRPQEVDMGYG